jgi:uncharacterized membrane protein YkvA (DUF1232 family)
LLHRNFMIARWKAAGKSLKRETYSLFLAYQDPRTPWYAKAFTVLVVAYAVSPIDLIPDFIPVLGYLDDLVLIPLGVWLSLKMIPPVVMEEARLRAREAAEGGKINSRSGLAVVLAIWAIGAVILLLVLVNLFRK